MAGKSLGIFFIENSNYKQIIRYYKIICTIIPYINCHGLLHHASRIDIHPLPCQELVPPKLGLLVVLVVGDDSMLSAVKLVFPEADL